MYVIECVEGVTIYCILLHAIKAWSFNFLMQYKVFQIISLWTILVLQILNKLICSCTPNCIFVFIPQNVLGVSSEELVGTLTNMVTFTRGEQIKRHYTKAMAEGEC